jgi:rare lipoprotein A
MRKLLPFILSIIIASFAIGQVLNKDKQKTDSQEKLKTTTQKDSIKKNKNSIDPKETIIDTTKVEIYKLKPYKSNVQASYYHDKFNGNKTSSGIRFDNNKYTAAHKKLPFGTKIKVTNISSGKSVIVEIIDRGPFTKSRELDLTKKAFMEIAKNKGIGVMKVNIELVE